jgi:hypothetical protein
MWGKTRVKGLRGAAGIGVGGVSTVYWGEARASVDAAGAIDAGLAVSAVGFTAVGSG